MGFPGNLSGSDPRDPPGSHSMNDNGENDLNALRETVRRLSFWIMQITGALTSERILTKCPFPIHKNVSRPGAVEERSRDSSAEV